MKIENLGNLLGLSKGTPVSEEDLPEGFLDLLFLLFKNGEERLPLEEGFSPLSEGNSPFRGDLKQRTFFLEDKLSEGLKDPLPNASEENDPLFVPQEALWVESTVGKKTFKETQDKQGAPLCETTSKMRQDTKASQEELSKENLQEEVAEEALRLLAPFYARQNGLPLTKDDFPAWLEKIFSAPLVSRAPLSPPNLKEGGFSPASVKEKPELVPEEAFISEAQDESDLGLKDTSHFTYLKIDSFSPKDVQTPPAAKDLFQEKAKINLAEKEDPSPPREKEGFQPEPLETSSFHPQDRLHPKGNQEIAPAPKGPKKEDKIEDLSPDPLLEHLERKEPFHHQAKEPTSPPPKVSPAELPEFVKEMVVKTHPEGKHEARLKLHPPELGEIHLSVSVDRGEVKLLLTVEHPRAAEAIQQYLHQLEVSLQELGLQLGGAEINLAGGGAQDQAPKRDKIYSSSPSLTKEAEGVEEIRSTPKRKSLIDLHV